MDCPAGKLLRSDQSAIPRSIKNCISEVYTYIHAMSQGSKIWNIIYFFTYGKKGQKQGLLPPFVGISSAT